MNGVIPAAKGELSRGNGEIPSGVEAVICRVHGKGASGDGKSAFCLDAHLAGGVLFLRSGIRRSGAFPEAKTAGITAGHGDTGTALSRCELEDTPV